LGIFLNRSPTGRRRRPKNPISEICRLVSAYIRLRHRAIRRDPHLFGPRAHRYYQDTIRLEQRQREIDAALHRVYGPDPAADSTSAAARHSVWADRYFIQPKNQRLFRKWFRETYGS
jgi:hypothetical protein